MMEVTPHLKSVLKNYQYSATKSLQGPGLSLNPVPIKNEPPSPEGGCEADDFKAAPAPPFPSVPILAAPDTSCSERSETILEGEAISCFVVGGEKRLCLPQVLNSVLRDFTLQEINRECDELQIYCSRCTPEQLNVLKSHAILPSGAPSCGLITKTDAERLCSALLFAGSKNVPLRPRKGLACFPIYHECFGEARGQCYPDLYTGKQAKCIECADCQAGFSPQQFVCHVHRNLENRTVHWGFDSSSQWRAYLHVPDDQDDRDTFEKVLDDLRDRYEDKVPFPPPPVVETAVKRKQIAASDLVKDHQAAAISSASELPLKKQKLDEYLLGRAVPTFPLPTAAAALMQQQIFSTLEPGYIHRYLQEFNNVRGHLSAFKPVAQSIKEQKLRSANAMGLTRCAVEPPQLQNPDKVVKMTESERFETSYQPNVALVPPTPKKHRYGRTHESNGTAAPTASREDIKEEEKLPSHQGEPPPPLTNGRNHVKEERDTSTIKTPPPPPQSTVLQPTAKYNPEIELSTDTDDSASETSEKHHQSDHAKLEDVLKSLREDDTRDKILELFRNLAKERERVVAENLKLKRELAELRRPINGHAMDVASSSAQPHQKSVIASVASVAGDAQQDVIKNTAPE